MLWYSIKLDAEARLPDHQQTMLDRYFGKTKDSERGAAYIRLEGNRTVLYLTPDAQAIALAIGAARCDKPEKGMKLTPHRGTRDNLVVE